MKTLRNACAATILMLVLAISVLAGEIDCPGVVSPPPPPPPETSTTTTTNITTTIIVTILGLIP